MQSENQISGDVSAERGIPGTSTRKKSRVGTLVVLVVVVALICLGVTFAIMTINRFTATKLAERSAARKIEADKRQSAGQPNDLTALKEKVKNHEVGS